MTPARSASEHVIHMIEQRRARADGKRRNAEELIRQAQRDDAEADALAAMLEAAGMGSEPRVHFNDPKVDA